MSASLPTLLLVCFLGLVALLVIVIAPVFLVNRILGQGKSSRRNAMDREEAAALQGLHRTAARMEDRVDSIETLLVDTEKERLG